MNTQDKRFLAAALGDGYEAAYPPGRAVLGQYTLAHSLEWPFAPHAGIRSFTIHYPTHGAPPPSARLILVASWGTGITGTELSIGLDLNMEPMDTNDLFGKAERLIGQIVSPETAPATKNTVQIDFAERLTPGAETFGLAKLRARILWQAGSRHILRIHRQMPAGWPDGNHHETDESAFTGRTAPLPAIDTPAESRPCYVILGVPMLTPTRRKIFEIAVSDLVPSLAWLRENAR